MNTLKDASAACLRCNDVVGPNGKAWHVRRYVTRTELSVALCPACDNARGEGCAVCAQPPLTSIPLCVDCLIDHETRIGSLLRAQG